MRDGTTSLKLLFEGDLADFESGDALPDSAGGWAVVRSVDESEDGEKTHVLRAESIIPAGAPLPQSYALADDPDSDLFLRFPTQYRREVREDGVYHFFHRTYPEREWSFIQYWEESLLGDQHRKLAEKPIEELTEGERHTLFEAFAAFEAHKQVELARNALAESFPSITNPTELWARQALLDAYGQADLDAIAERCISLTDSVERTDCYELESDRLRARAHAAYRGVLMREARLDEQGLAIFDRAMDRAWKRHDLTGQLAGHHFEIDVQMPGQLVAHNSDRADLRTHSVKATWEFDGRAFRDRTFEIILITCESLDNVAKDVDSPHDR